MATNILVPSYFPITNPSLPDPNDLLEEMRAVFASGRVTMGSNVEALERENCIRAGVKHSVAVSCATSGLILLLRALDLPKDSEVITPSFTFAATTHALLWNGLKPVLCDSEPDTFTMDASAAAALITGKTSAIYPVCIFGVPGDLDSYEELAQKHGLALIFDSAQGLGSTYKGKELGGFGNAEVFSLSPTKVVTAMEGGLITTNDDGLADKLKHMRDYGKASDGEDMCWLGLSARMSEVNAMVARWSLARAELWMANRRAALERYRHNLRDVPGLTFQYIPEHCTSTLNYAVIQIDPDTSPITRNELYLQLKDKSVQTKRYFHPAVHNQSLYRDLEPGSRMRLRVTEKISSRGLALPMYSRMSLADVDEICDRILDCMRREVIRPSI